MEEGRGCSPGEAQLDPSQLLAQQSSPQTELPESRRGEGG